MTEPEILKDVDQQKLRQWLTDLNGHRVWAPIFFESMGFPQDFVREYLREHEAEIFETKLELEPYYDVRLPQEYLIYVIEQAGANVSAWVSDVLGWYIKQEGWKHMRIMPSRGESKNNRIKVYFSNNGNREAFREICNTIKSETQLVIADAICEYKEAHDEQPQF